MDFSVPAHLCTHLERTREFINERVIPVEQEVLGAEFTHSVALLGELRDEVKEIGLWTPQLPRSLGGMGLSNLEHGLMSAELGRSPLGHYVFGCQAPDAGNMEILHQFGTVAQKKEFLEPLVRGDIRSCFSMTEPAHAGSNPTEMSCTAERDGDAYVVRGHKWFTTAADGAAFAITMAVTHPGSPPHKRASQIIVPCDTPGFELVRNIPIMGHTGSGWFSHAEIQYNDCRVPAKNLLGQEGAGFAIAQERLGPGRIHHCMRWIGICERAFEMMCDRAATRELSPGTMLGSKQTIQNWIAESRAEIDACRWSVLHAAWTIDNVGAKTARNNIAAIKFHTAGVLLKVIDRSIQTHGALGMTSDTVLAHFYVHERGARIYDGPDEVHKASLAKRILRRRTPAQ